MGGGEKLQRKLQTVVELKGHADQRDQPYDTQEGSADAFKAPLRCQLIRDSTRGLPFLGKSSLIANRFLGFRC
jgi:hypothetical protein